jgi:hypothetical protein
MGGMFVDLGWRNKCLVLFLKLRFGSLLTFLLLLQGI